MQRVVLVFKLGRVQIKLDMAVIVHEMRPENVLTFLLAQWMDLSHNGAAGACVVKLVEVVQQFEIEHAKNLNMAEKTVLDKLGKAPSVQILLCAQMKRVLVFGVNGVNVMFRVSAVFKLVKGVVAQMIKVLAWEVKLG